VVGYLSLQSVDDIEGCDSLSLGVFGVGDSITNNTFKEDFENTTGLVISLRSHNNGARILLRR
jgi:hypothetical protein